MMELSVFLKELKTADGHKGLELVELYQSGGVTKDLESNGLPKSPLDMVKNTESTLREQLSRLEHQLAKARSFGADGHNLAQRHEMDIERIINSAWLNCSDFSYR